jgi:hypothetical protein
VIFRISSSCRAAPDDTRAQSDLEPANVAFQLPAMTAGGEGAVNKSTAMTSLQTSTEVEGTAVTPPMDQQPVYNLTAAAAENTIFAPTDTALDEGNGSAPGIQAEKIATETIEQENSHAHSKDAENTREEKNHNVSEEVYEVQETQEVQHMTKDGGGQMENTVGIVKEEENAGGSGFSALSQGTLQDQMGVTMASPMAATDAFHPMADFSQLHNFDGGLNGLHNPFQSHDLLALAGMGGLDGLNGLGPLANSFPPLGHNQFPNPPMDTVEETRVSAYAKLIFPDGHFYMNTYSIILGRDKVATKAARLDKLDQAKLLDAAHEPKTPRRGKGSRSRYSKSLVSESGGILRDRDDSDPEERMRRRKLRKGSKKSRSTDSSLKNVSRRNSLIHPPSFYEPQQVHPTFTLPVDTAPVIDPATLRPSPKECPLISIHPPVQDAATGKSISREHVKIGYNAKKHLFEAEILGRNGVFVDEVHYNKSDIVPLNSGSWLQIGTLPIQFVLPDVAIGSTGAEDLQEYDYEHDEEIPDRYTEGGKSMSFDFEDVPRDGLTLQDTSEESSEELGGNEDEELGEGEEQVGKLIQDDDQEEDFRDRDESEQSQVNLDEDEEEVKEESRSQEPTAIGGTSSKPNKKRGPGRPPKDGVMSKREKRELKLAMQQELAQQKFNKIAPPPASETPEMEGSAEGKGKNKVGRPRKHPKPDTSPVQKEKRKYTKRKPKESKDPNVKEEGSGEDKPATEKKMKKPKPPRSPSPTFNEADLTPEQLAKPTANYVQLIHEALTSSDKGSMTLPQIYRAIQRKYPYFVCKTTTIGWQSSVRHNLSQHGAFQKDERDGKGYKWSIVKGVPVEKEKKRKPTPPPQMPGYQNQQPIYPGYGPPYPPPGYYVQQGPYAPYPHGPPPMNGYPPHYFPPPPPTVPLAPTGGSYSSPYAPKQDATVSKPSVHQSPYPPPPPPPPGSGQGPPPAHQPGPTHQHNPPPQPSPPEQQPMPHQYSGPPQQPMLYQQHYDHSQLPQPQRPAQAKVQQPSHQPPQAVAKPATKPAPVPAPPPPINPQPAENVRKLIETLKSSITNYPKAVVDAAADRLLGKPAQTSGDPQEEHVYGIMARTLSGVPSLNFKLPANVAQQHHERQPVSQSSANQSETRGDSTPQPINSSNSDKSAASIVKPSLMEQGIDRQAVASPLLALEVPNPSITTSESPGSLQYAGLPEASSLPNGSNSISASHPVHGSAATSPVLSAPPTNVDTPVSAIPVATMYGANMKFASPSLPVTALDVSAPVSKGADITTEAPGSMLPLASPVTGPTTPKTNIKPGSPLIAPSAQLTSPKIGQLAGQKRPLDDATMNDVPELKRQATG